MNDAVSRKSFVAAAGALLLSRGLWSAKTGDRPLPTPEELKTPYRLGRLVLKGSGTPGDFDEKSVDCSFVFRRDDRFYMTMVGCDGTGYQTGLASSDDLLHWKREGCILHRDPQSAVTRYNIAMTWILRENDIFSAGKAIEVDGRYLASGTPIPMQAMRPALQSSVSAGAKTFSIGQSTRHVSILTTPIPPPGSKAAYTSPASSGTTACTTSSTTPRPSPPPKKAM